MEYFWNREAIRLNYFKNNLPEAILGPDGRQFVCTQKYIMRKQIITQVFTNIILFTFAKLSVYFFIYLAKPLFYGVGPIEIYFVFSLDGIQQRTYEHFIFFLVLKMVFFFINLIIFRKENYLVNFPQKKCIKLKYFIWTFYGL